MEIKHSPPVHGFLTLPFSFVRSTFKTIRILLHDDVLSAIKLWIFFLQTEKLFDLDVVLTPLLRYYIHLRSLKEKEKRKRKIENFPVESLGTYVQLAMKKNLTLSVIMRSLSSLDIELENKINDKSLQDNSQDKRFVVILINQNNK